MDSDKIVLPFMNMRQLPNLLSVSRIVMCLVALCVIHYSSWFVALYLLAAFTVLIDGPIARRWGAVTQAGARLDSIADIFLFGAITAYLIVAESELVYDRRYYLVAIAGLRLLSIAVGLIRFRKLVMIHTLGNKLAGLMVAALPVLLFFGADWYVWLVIMVALLSALEELILLLSARGVSPDPDRKGLFF